MQEVLVNQKICTHPDIELTVRRVESKVWYNLGFYKHHYLTSDMNMGAMCFLFEWNGNPVGFCSILNKAIPQNHYMMGVSRIVILPDYQGLGLSTKILDFMGGVVESLKTEDKNYTLCIKTAHDKMGVGLSHNKNWVSTNMDGKERLEAIEDAEEAKKKGLKSIHLKRMSYCKKYIGKPIKGFEYLFDKIDNLRTEKNNKRFVGGGFNW